MKEQVTANQEGDYFLQFPAIFQVLTSIGITESPGIILAQSMLYSKVKFKKSEGIIFPTAIEQFVLGCVATISHFIFKVAWDFNTLELVNLTLTDYFMSLKSWSFLVLHEEASIYSHS